LTHRNLTVETSENSLAVLHKDRQVLGCPTRRHGEKREETQNKSYKFTYGVLCLTQRFYKPVLRHLLGPSAMRRKKSKGKSRAKKASAKLADVVDNP
jgi:hypothetical protein